MEIMKKTWPELFQRMVDGKKTADVRLADFWIKEGDTLILEEYDPKANAYTGRVLKKRVKNLAKVKLTDFNTPEEIAKYGHWVILGEAKLLRDSKKLRFSRIELE